MLSPQKQTNNSIAHINECKYQIVKTKPDMQYKFTDEMPDPAA